MEIIAGAQVTINERPAVVLGCMPFPDCTVVCFLRPGVLVPSVVEGRTRPGSLSKKFVTLLTFRDGTWHWDYHHRVRVAANLNPQTHIPLESWMAALAQSIHPMALR
jgi:hypothetical protein